MPRRFLLVVVLVLLAFSLVGQAVSLEARVGTGPSVSALVDWEIDSKLSISTSLGLGTIPPQTPSETVQTASLTIGVAGRYTFSTVDSLVRPYVGIGGDLVVQEQGTSVLLSILAGAEMRITPSVYALCEATLYVPVADIATWYWRPYLGIGFRLPF